MKNKYVRRCPAELEIAPQSVMSALLRQICGQRACEADMADLGTKKGSERFPVRFLFDNYIFDMTTH